MERAVRPGWAGSARGRCAGAGRRRDGWCRRPSAPSSAETIEPSESTAICVVAAPQTRIMVASGCSTGSPQPTAGGDEGVDQLDLLGARARSGSPRRRCVRAGRRRAGCRRRRAASRACAATRGGRVVAEQARAASAGPSRCRHGAVGDRAYDPDVAGGAAVHPLGERADGDEGSGGGVHGDGRRFVDDEAPPA